MASQITSLKIVYSNVYSGANQRKHQSCESLAFVRGIHRWPVNSPPKGPVAREMFPFDDVILLCTIPNSRDFLHFAPKKLPAFQTLIANADPEFRFPWSWDARRDSEANPIETMIYWCELNNETITPRQQCINPFRCSWTERNTLFRHWFYKML